MEIRIAYLFCLCFFCSMMSNAQVMDSIPDLPADEVEVIKNFELRATDLNPLFLQPKLSEIEKDDYSFNYDFTIPNVDFEPPKPQIRPLAYNKPLDKRIYDGFIDLSFGTPTSPKVDLGYNYHVEDWFEFGVLADYFSASDGDSGLRDFDKTNLKLFAGYNLTKAIRLDVSTDYKADNFNLFANGITSDFEAAYDRFDFTPSLTFDWFEKTKTLINLTTRYTVTDLNPESNKENILGIGLDVNQGFGNDALLSVSAGFDHYKFDSLATYDLLQIEPILHLNKKQFNLEVGGSINSFSPDSLLILPILNFNYKLSDKLSVLAGVRSEYILYDLNTQYAQNPFLSFDEQNYFAGSSISPYLGTKLQQGNHSLSINANYNFDKNFPVWIKNQIFNTYSLGQLNKLDYFSADLNYTFAIKSTAFNLFGTYRFIDNPFVRNWHLNGSIQQSIVEDKIKLALEYFSNDSRLFSSKQLDQLHDLNFKADFNISERISIYGQVLNILDREYEFVVDYPGFGRTYRGGVFVRI